VRKILFVVALLTVCLVAYVKPHALTTPVPEYEFTVSERLGPANHADPYPGGAVVTKTFFRRKDGTSGYAIKDQRNGTTVTTVEYLSPAQQARIVVLVEKKLKTTYPAPPQQAQEWASPPQLADCSERYIGSTKIGDTQLMGVAVEKLKTENNTETMEAYAAPSLACAALQVRHQWKDAKGVYTSWTNDDLVSVRIGPPSPSYFDLDADSKEVPPSTAQMAIRAMLHPNEPACPQCSIDGNRRSDARYYAAREQAQKGWPDVTKIDGKQ
jgi:hypothetical protein